MEDRDIIKALECCRNGLCTDCPRLNTPSAILRCKEELMCDTLDLINRQKAEIGRLNKQLEELKFLESRVNSIKNTPKDTFSGILISMAEGVARYEAVKEFAERLKEKAVDVGICDAQGNGYGGATVILIGDIDNLVKEMVGEG